MEKLNKELQWEQKKAEMHSLRDLKNSFQLNIGNDADKFLAILQGKYKPPPLPNEPAKISRPNNINHRKAEAIKNNEAEKSAHMNIKETKETDSATYVLQKELAKFACLKNAQTALRLTPVIIQAVRNALNDTILKSVAKNTKAAFKNYCTKITKIANGLKVTFTLNNKNIEVLASGPFYGDETVCIYKENTKLKTGILKITENGPVNLTDQFTIKMKEL